MVLGAISGFGVAIGFLWFGVAALGVAGVYALLPKRKKRELMELIESFSD